MDMEFLKKMLSCMSVSGYEEAVQDCITEEMKVHADEIRRDEMNNLVCVKNPQSAVRIMLSAHADEIGLMVSDIKETGELCVIARGGIVVPAYPAHKVQIYGKNGPIYGVVEADRELFKKKELGTRDLLIDIGVETKEEAEALASVGDPVIFDTGYRPLSGGRFTARALDDRIGVYIIMEAFKRAAARGAKNGLYGAATVGEETTMNGAYWSAKRIKPSLAVVVDVTYTSDRSVGGKAEDCGPVKLGGGPVLCYSPIVCKALNRKMAECAEKAGIKVQWEVAGDLSHTDGDKIHFSNDGVPVVLVSIPLRYMHMPSEVADERDVESCIELIARFLTDYEGE